MHPDALHFNSVVFNVIMMTMLIGGTVLVIAAIIAVWCAFSRVKQTFAARRR